MPALKQSSGIDETLAAIVAHPLRARILGVLAERTASPRQLSALLNCELSDAAYHTRKLRDLDVIELVGTEPARGATQHFYRAIKRPYVSAEEYALLTQNERNGFAREICQLGFADAAAALATESFSSRADNCVARAPVQVDEEGWAELSRLYDETLAKTLEIEARSNERRIETKEEPAVRAEGILLLFERGRLEGK